MKAADLWLSLRLIGAAAAVSSCADRAMTGPGPSPDALVARDVGTASADTTRPRLPLGAPLFSASTPQPIGSAGGTAAEASGSVAPRKHHNYAVAW